MDRVEQQLRVIQAVYRVERARQSGAQLDEFRGRCEALLDNTEPATVGDPRLEALVEEIRAQLRS